MCRKVWYQSQALTITNRNIARPAHSFDDSGMPVVIRPVSKPAAEALSLEEIRARLEQKLLSAHEEWDFEKKRLEEAMARAEGKEREYREVAEDVRRRLEALELVTAMALGMDEPTKAGELPKPGMPAMLPEPGATQQQLQMIDEKQRTELRAPATSRPLFSHEVRAGLCSILR